MTSTRVNRQLMLMQKAREGASFNTFELTCLIHGGEDVVQQRRAALKRVEISSGTHDTSILPRCYANMNREEAFDEGLKMGSIAFTDGLKHKHHFFHVATPRYTLGNSSPFGLIPLLFEPAIELNSTSEQKAKWLPLSRAGKILGTYCQTELGHGTFVRGLETTSTFDGKTDELILHSPTLSSMKFWPGSLGFSATNAIVMARLVIGAKDYGPHLFMVQLRSLEDGKPLKGIRMGDVGLKMSYNGTDNGFATFDHVRIPRTDMLMGHVTVSRSGSFSAVAEHATLTYSIMVVGRLVITRNIAFQLAQAVTIATRYSIVREQGFGQGADDRQPNESTIMSYRSQHFRLLTLIAKAYAIFFAAQQADLEYKTLRELQENQDSSGLPYTHSISAGLKAWSTSEAADGAEDARKCCGGHGFWMISGLPDIVASVTATATFEGENYVMWQQVGRYLFKCMDAARQGRALDAQLVYLTDSRGRGRDSTQFPCEAKESDFLSEEVQLDIFRHRAQRLVHFAHAAVRSSQEPPADAWNEHMMSIISASRAHIEYTVLKSFAHHLHNIPPTTTPLLRSILSHLRSLFTLSTIINPRTVDAISFVEDGYLDVLQLETIRSLVNELLDKLLPEATGLTDAWDFSHASLCSALGMWDGDAYEHIMRWVEQMPINRRAWDENEGVYQPGWKEVVDPILKAKL